MVTLSTAGNPTVYHLRPIPKVKLHIFVHDLVLQDTTLEPHPQAGSHRTKGIYYSLATAYRRSAGRGKSMA